MGEEWQRDPGEHSCCTAPEEQSAQTPPLPCTVTPTGFQYSSAELPGHARAPSPVFLPALRVQQHPAPFHPSGKDQPCGLVHTKVPGVGHSGLSGAPP